jgi:hypothetical protein
MHLYITCRWQSTCKLLVHIIVLFLGTICKLFCQISPKQLIAEVCWRKFGIHLFFKIDAVVLHFDCVKVPNFSEIKCNAVKLHLKILKTIKEVSPMTKFSCKRFFEKFGRKVFQLSASNFFKSLDAVSRFCKKINFKVGK